MSNLMYSSVHHKIPCHRIEVLSQHTNEGLRQLNISSLFTLDCGDSVQCFSLHLVRSLNILISDQLFQFYSMLYQTILKIHYIVVPNDLTLPRSLTGNMMVFRSRAAAAALFALFIEHRFLCRVHKALSSTLRSSADDTVVERGVWMQTCCRVSKCRVVK